MKTHLKETSQLGMQLVCGDEQPVMKELANLTEWLTAEPFYIHRGDYNWLSLALSLTYDSSMFMWNDFSIPKFRNVPALHKVIEVFECGTSVRLTFEDVTTGKQSYILFSYDKPNKLGIVINGEIIVLERTKNKLANYNPILELQAIINNWMLTGKVSNVTGNLDSALVTLDQIYYNRVTDDNLHIAEKNGWCCEVLFLVDELGVVFNTKDNVTAEGVLSFMDVNNSYYKADFTFRHVIDGSSHFGTIKIYPKYIEVAFWQDERSFTIHRNISEQ